MSSINKENETSTGSRTRSLQEICEAARNPYITDEAVIGRILSRLTDMPAAGFYHPSIRNQISYTPWYIVLEAMCLPEETPEILHFGEMMFLLDCHLKGIGEIQDGLLLEHLARLALGYSN